MHNKNEPLVENKNSMAYPSRTLDPPFTIVDRAREIQLAGSSVESHTNAKLDIILKQIRSLQEEAKKVIDQAAEDMRLHGIKCNFEKKIGMTIYLYERPDGEKYFSMLSPADWDNPLYKFHGSYRIKPDYGFDKLD